MGIRVSNSSVQTFKRCRRMWELQYKFGLRPKTVAPALETGSAYHSKIESIINTGDFEPDMDAKTNAMANAFKRYIYPKLIAEKFEPELWFEYRTVGGNLVVGRYDGSGRSAVLEHKTTSGKIDGSYWNTIELDEQLLTYMMASGKQKAYYTVCRKPTIKQTVHETDEDFQKRCNAWYDVDTDEKISLEIVTHERDELAQHEHEIDMICDEMEHCHNYYRNTAYCSHWNRPCEFLPICKNYKASDGIPIGFELRG